MKNKYLIKITYNNGNVENIIANNYKLTENYISYDYYNNGFHRYFIDILIISEINIFQGTLLKTLIYV